MAGVADKGVIKITNGEKIQKDFKGCVVCEPIIEDNIIHVIFADKKDSAIGFDWSWWNSEYKEPTTKIDYRRAFKIACDLLNGDILYGVDTDKIYEIMMQKDDVVSSSSYEEYILNHLQELDQGQYASESTTKNNLAVDKLISDCEKMSFDMEIFNKPLKVVALDAVKNIVRALSSVTPIRPKGHWIGNYQVDFGEWQEYDVKLSDGYVTDNCHCSECDEELLSGDRGMFCPNCGADMRISEENDV